MKSIVASLCFISPIAASRFGLLRVDGPDVTAHRATGVTSDLREDLKKEDLNLVFRQLFGYSDLSLSASTDLSLSMSEQYMSLSMNWDSSSNWSGSWSGSSSAGDTESGQLNEGTSASVPTEGDNSETTESTQSPNEDTDPPTIDDESSSSGQAAGSSTESGTNTSGTSSEKGETGKKAMIGILSIAGVALVGAAVARKMKKDASTASDGENSSVPSDASMEGNMENVPL